MTFISYLLYGFQEIVKDGNGTESFAFEFVIV